MSSLREAQKQLTRDVIVERALELFTEKGYAATTIDDIAAAAGTTGPHRRRTGGRRACG
ncbi:MAG: TetR family transcriptional regulator [Pseudarthrobacter sp.]